MKDLISHFFSPKALQHHKRYLIRDIYKPCGTNIHDFICQIDKMVKYLEKFPPFGVGQRLPEYEIPKLVEFSIPEEWQKLIIIQRFNSSTQGLMELV